MYPLYCIAWNLSTRLYCIAWGNVYFSNIYEIELLQKKVIRIIKD